MDTDQDGTVDFDEMMACLEEILSEKPTTDDVMDLFNLIDEDGNGEVSHEEVTYFSESIFFINSVKFVLISANKFQ